MKNNLLLALALIFSLFATAQKSGTENVIIVTMDGLRWQEVFQGADSVLTHDTTAIYSTKHVQRKFWGENEQARRKKLMPFLWSVVVEKGLLLGNRHFKNYVENANPYWFSYPGYNELFTGYPDTAVNSNDKVPNKNESVLGYLNTLPEYKNKVAVFGSWNVFSSIFNAQSSGLFVNDGFKNVTGTITEKQQLYNKLQFELPDLFKEDERLDAATFNMGFEYMKVNKPKVMFFGLGDTDEFAHAGMYDLYLDAAQKSDAWIKQLWEYIQSTPSYANKTTLIITTDHGRGVAAGGTWKHHGQKIPESKEMWMAAIGPSVKPTGESKQAALVYQGQLAATIAALLGKEFKPQHPVLPKLEWKYAR